jgi:uncharacterized protein (DUF302 family)
MRQFVKLLANEISFSSKVACIVAGGYVTSALALDDVETRQIKGSFEDVYFDLKNSIVNEGLVIDTVLHVSDMLNRTGKDVGSTKPVYLHGQTLGFCSATLSRAAVEADPENLAFCPYSIFIYEAVGTPNMITVGYRKLTGATNAESEKALGAINDLLNKIISNVSGD